MRDPVVQRERLALKLAVQHPLLCSDFDHLDADMFTVEQHREVFQLIQKEGGTRSVQDPARWPGSYGRPPTPKRSGPSSRN